MTSAENALRSQVEWLSTALAAEREKVERLEELRALDALATRWGMTRSETVRRAVSEAASEAWRKRGEA